MGIKKKTRQRIKKYAALVRKDNPDIQADCLLEVYGNASEQDRRFYEAEMDRRLGLVLVDE